MNLVLDKLTQFKIPTLENPGEVLLDLGLDGCHDEIETGYTEINEIHCLDTLTFNHYCGDDTLPDIGQFINPVVCQYFLENNIE